jgi:hypothetical protein
VAPYGIIAREVFPVPDEERHYRVIGTYAEGILKGQPEELAAVLQRLEKEYQQLQAGRQTPSTAATVPIEPSH